MLCRFARRLTKRILSKLLRDNRRCQKVTFVRSNPEMIPPRTGEVLSLALNHGEHREGSLYRLKRGTTLRIVPGVSLLGRQIALSTNYPAKDAAYSRDHFRQLQWHNKNGAPLGKSNQFVEVISLDVYCEIVVNTSGSFKFEFEYEGGAGTKEGSLYVQVEPLIQVGPPNAKRTIPLDSIRCQTVMTKCMGALSTWPAKLQVAHESGYNMLHLTPIQELGASRSGYSLANQQKVNPQFGETVTFDDVEKVMRQCREEWGISSICDIVLNHTANESEWLREHPDSTYSCCNSKHLRPAFLLDAVLAMASNDAAAGLLVGNGVPEVIDHEHHVEALRYQLHSNYLQRAKIWELYQVDVDAYAKRFNEDIRKGQPQNVPEGLTASDITFKQNVDYKRLACTIDYEKALAVFNVYRPDCFDEDSRLRRCAECFRGHLDHLNEEVRKDIQEHLNAAVDNCLAGLRYERLQDDGPKLREISKRHPLFCRYFTDNNATCKSVSDIEALMYGASAKFLMAHNGWVINGDPLNDFALPPKQGTANVYIRRELIAWGDSVKLRYGDKPADSPYLWDHMRRYVEKTAQIFDGVRLDNCHSTPLHVAEYLLDCARKINPELYVVAELFTNSDHADNIFVNRLGITSLVREALSAWDSHEEGRLVHRYGGSPVGAFCASPKRILAPNIAHALFLDLTHDNPSPVQKRSVFDLLPSAALVSMACCATGSTRGYDELVPHHIHVVDEERQYQHWNQHINFESGIIAAKRALNELHGELADQGYSQVYVDQMNPDIVAITRHSPTTHQSVILVAHTSFSYPHPHAGPTPIQSLAFEGKLDEIILEASLVNKCGQEFDRPGQYTKNEEFINGLTEYQSKVQTHIQLKDSTIFWQKADHEGNTTKLNFRNLKPGSVVAVRVSLKEELRKDIEQLQQLVVAIHNESGAVYEELQEIVGLLNLDDLNKAIYRCDEEERDMGHSNGCYDVPNYGRLVYSGTQGLASVLAEIAPNNDLGHPLCNNLREGNWMIDYVHQRLTRFENTKKLAKWLEVNTESLKRIPRYMIPSYFDVVIGGVHNLLKQRAFELMSDFVKNGSTIVQALAMGSLQFIAKCESSNLPTLSPNTKPPKPGNLCATLSAGLPHFSTGYMRAWGRDTFIAIRGLMYLCGRYNEARYIILGFASTLRHGLIPNLLDGGYKSRFNCRDAVWWWLYSIKLYVEEAPNGAEILTEKVSRIFPTDDSEARKAGEVEQPLCDVIQEAITVHFQGLVYRERNAGTAIDAHMKERGFNNQIGIHPETGFVFGGNSANCGTWMDKMGSSDKAGNRGKPSTPRDGSAVELVGLQMASIRFLEAVNKKGVYPYKSVRRVAKNGEQREVEWTWKEMGDKIQENFERSFFVGSKEVPNANKVGIYKDSFGASEAWQDGQLRPNFLVAMVAAPELFNPEHAWTALEMAEKYLLGPLGMKTLDPEDWGYRADYDNSDDGTDGSVAHGANYHQGPEWVWPIGFYLRARLIFAGKTGRQKEEVTKIWAVLAKHIQELQTSHWRGLPELTNSNGTYCRDSCRTQAWSMATVLEVVYDLQRVSEAK